MTVVVESQIGTRGRPAKAEAGKHARKPGPANALLRALRRLPVIGPVLARATLIRRYRLAKGCAPRLDPPVTFDERMLARILRDRDPRLKILNDKLAMRAEVARLAGPGFVVPLLGCWDDPDRIDWAALPERFVLKASHASGRVALVREAAQRDPAALAARARDWLATDYFDVSLEWGYRGLPRRILAEPLLAGPDGGLPPELQVFTFGGRAALYRVQTGQKGMGGRADTWYDPTGRELDLHIGFRRCDVVLSAEQAAAAMAAAERVAAGFVQLRVDFYLTGDGLRIGELTPYHRAGRTLWQPPEWDARLGALWAEAEAAMARHAR